MTVSQDELRQAIDTLAESGKEHFMPEAWPSMTRGQKIGLALADELGARGVAELAYAAWEDMNAHDANRWLDLYWNLYGDSKYDLDLKTARRLDGHTLTINELVDGEWVKRKYLVTVQIDPVES